MGVYGLNCGRWQLPLGTLKVSSYHLLLVAVEGDRQPYGLSKGRICRGLVS